MDVWFSLKSSLIIHLNNSNRIRNEQVMAKIRKLVEIEQGVPHMFRTCTGTCLVLEGCTSTCPRCTGTCHSKMPRMCVFVPFFHIFPPNSTLYFIHTSKPFQIHLVTSIILNFSFNTYLNSKTYHELLSNPL